MSRFGFAAININQVRNGRGVLKIKAATVMEASAGRKRGVRKDGKSWVDRDPLRKIKVVSDVRMKQLRRLLSEV